ncbi:MAG: glycosyltransferase family 4 protein [Pseudomonadota bacterium]
MIRAQFAIPGDIQTPTGGYHYARRVMGETGAFGVTFDHLALPGQFPEPSQNEIAHAVARLSEVPADTPILLDGLAGGVLPAEAIAALSAPVIYLCHHPLADETGVDPTRRVVLRDGERSVMAASVRVVTTSHSTAANLAALYSVPHRKLVVAPPGTDPAERAHGSQSTPTILSVGSFTLRKGHDRLIEVLSGLKDLAWQLRIVGAVPNPAYRDAIESMITAHGLGDRVTILAPLSSEDLAREYQGADLFVLASYYEGFGMVFAEAVAHGLPVIGHRIGAVVEATLGTAELVPVGELAGPLERAIRSPAKRRAMADRSWQAATELCRWHDTARGIARAVQEVCE